MGVHQDTKTYLEVKRLLGIPPDEPIFILRAQDECAIAAIEAYRDIVHGKTIVGEESEEWVAQLGSVRSDFVNWYRDNRDKMKMPD